MFGMIVFLEEGSYAQQYSIYLIKNALKQYTVH